MVKEVFNELTFLEAIKCKYINKNIDINIWLRFYEILSLTKSCFYTYIMYVAYIQNLKKLMPIVQYVGELNISSTAFNGILVSDAKQLNL